MSAKEGVARGADRDSDEVNKKAKHWSLYNSQEANDDPRDTRKWIEIMTYRIECKTRDKNNYDKVERNSK